MQFATAVSPFLLQYVLRGQRFVHRIMIEKQINDSTETSYPRQSSKHCLEGLCIGREQVASQLVVWQGLELWNKSFSILGDIYG